jgi:AcrR family transcriptional regulator
MGRHADSARERIIDAAEQVVIDLGAGNLTFNSVASAAGVSRGGLLYHFPDKESLLKSMLDRLVTRTKEGRSKKRTQLPEGIDREIIAHVLSFLEEDDRTKTIAAAALFAIGAHDPGLLEPGREEYRKLMGELTKEGLRFERAAVIALATDGLRLLELLKISPFDKEQRSRIIGEMILLAKQIEEGEVAEVKTLDTVREKTENN